MTGRDPTERGHVVSSPVSPTTESAEVAGTSVAQSSERAIPEGNRRDSVERTREHLELPADALTLPSEGAAPRDGGRKRCPICTRPMATAWDWKTLDGSEGIGLCWAGREPLA